MRKPNFLTIKNLKIAFTLATFLILTGCTSVSQNFASDKIKIVSSFYPLYELAKNIGGDKVDAINLVPPGADPHDYEPTPKDLIDLQSSNLIIVNGAGLEPWADRLLPDLIQSGHTVIQASDSIKALNVADKNNDEEKNSTFDPHFWLNPLLYKNEADEVAAELQKIDPKNAAYYQENLNLVHQKIDNLDQSYQAGLKICSNRNVVTSHNAFSYLAKHYNLDVYSIAGLSPEEEPNPAKIAELADLVKKDNIKYIFTETLVSPKIAETLANEDKISTLIFDPIEGLTEDQLNAGQTYFTIMESNLKNLRTAMDCK